MIMAVILLFVFTNHIYAEQPTVNKIVQVDRLTTKHYDIAAFLYEGKTFTVSTSDTGRIDVDFANDQGDILTLTTSYREKCENF